METHVYSVAEITRQIKFLLEESFPLLWVEGEVSNYRPHHSGHLYFTLKDSEAQLACVMWRNRAAELKFELSDGMKVRLYGNIRVYEKSGRYQLDCFSIQPSGLGDLQLRFEKLKEQLFAEGLFDASHKKQIPAYPGRVGVITSPTGAAIRDIFSVIRRRAPSVEILFHGVKVQGEGAAQELSAVIEMFNRFGAVDVLIVGRGGGSLEDLWAFNEEILARAIFNSRIPVISAVGHEIDFTIADFVADLRAPTPSAAAEIVVQDEQELRKRLNRHAMEMSKRIFLRIELHRKKILDISRSYAFRAPEDRLRQYAQHLDDLIYRATLFTQRYIITRKEYLQNRAQHINALNPKKVLDRGYALIFREGELVKTAKGIEIDDQLAIQVHDGQIDSKVTSVRYEN